MFLFAYFYFKYKLYKVIHITVHFWYKCWSQEYLI